MAIVPRFIPSSTAARPIMKSCSEIGTPPASGIERGPMTQMAAVIRAVTVMEPVEKIGLVSEFETVIKKPHVT